jgi:hypothetical protein
MQLSACNLCFIFWLYRTRISAESHFSWFTSVPPEKSASKHKSSVSFIVNYLRWSKIRRCVILQFIKECLTKRESVTVLCIRNTWNIFKRKLLTSRKINPSRRPVHMGSECWLHVGYIRPPVWTPKLRISIHTELAAAVTWYAFWFVQA